jgi:hypothetical protein
MLRQCSQVNGTRPQAFTCRAKSQCRLLLSGDFFSDELAMKSAPQSAISFHIIPFENKNQNGHRPFHSLALANRRKAS